MQLVPYLFFDGTCEEALAFYATVFGGGTTALNRYDEAPSDVGMPPEKAKQILHATFEAPGFQFMASDGGPMGAGEMNRASVSIATASVEEGRRIFNGLVAGGAVSMPYEKQFWGATFGSLTDKFGISWMVNAG